MCNQKPKSLLEESLEVTLLSEKNPKQNSVEKKYCKYIFF